MKKKQPGAKKFADLRRRAEKEAAAVRVKANVSLSPEETQRTLHELHVHQIELELQNEELRGAQTELEAARARYFDLYDLAPIGYFTISEKGLIQEANLTAARMLGLGKTQLVKQPFTRFILNEDQDVYYQHRKLLFKSHSPQVCDVRIMNKEGNPFWARLQSLIRQEGMDEAAGAPEPQGEPVCRTVMSDISLLKQAEENAKINKALLNETEKMGKIGGWSFDAEKLAETWTDETFRILEIDLIQTPPKMRGGMELIAPAFRPMAEHAIRQAIESGVPFDQEWEVITAKGNKRWLHAVAKTRKEKGKTRFVSGFFQDISELKQAEEKLRNSLAEKELLLKEVHLRIKNNLLTIIGLIKMLETKAGNEMESLLMRELEGRVRSIALVHESLDKSEHRACVNLQRYFETISVLVRDQFGAERGIRCTVQAAGVDVGPDIAVAYGLILNELITNAYKHAFPGDKPRSGSENCEIAVTVKHDSGKLTLTVADNGVGLPAEMNWENSESLGLRLVMMLCRQLNGSIELDRTRGAAFHLHLAHSPAAG